MDDGFAFDSEPMEEEDNEMDIAFVQGEVREGGNCYLPESCNDSHFRALRT